MDNIPKMPKEYIGEYGKDTNYIINKPRKWTEKEIEWTKKMLDQGYTQKEIALSLDRSVTSVALKVKRLGKKQNTYNNEHIDEKYRLNNMFLEKIQPKTVLDLYVGEKNFYKNYKVTTNDINKNIKADYHKDAHKLICELYSKNKKYDLIDLDPFGSAYDCFDLAIKMAKKGLIITLGELGHKRWKRLDYVSRYYGINDLDDFTIENLIKEIQKIGLRNKKKLVVVQYQEWKNIGRVYFKIENIKITSQWETNN